MFKHIQSFVEVANRGSLSAAARALGVTPTVIGRRLDALEARLGVRLFVRTTRSLSLTFEGESFFENCQRILADLAEAEASVSAGGERPRGHLRITAPAGFGRLHVAPIVRGMLKQNPELSCSLDLSDRIVDLVNEGFDCGVRIGELADSSLVSIKLAQMSRVVVGSPEYFQRYGTPRTPDDLAAHKCLVLGAQRGWVFRQPGCGGASLFTKLNGPFACNDGSVLREWALAGAGLAWRSLWEVGEDLSAGRLVCVLQDWAAPPVGVWAVLPQRKHLPLRVRLLLDLLKQHLGKERWNVLAV